MGQASGARRFNPRMRVLLASSSLAALLVAGGAPSAMAAPNCKIIQNGGTVATVPNNSATGNCILVEGGANVTGNVTNTSTGVLTTNGAASPSLTGITITNSTVGGSVSNAGAITAQYAGIVVDANAIVTGGISNGAGGTISTVKSGIAVGFGGVSTFSGGITNAGVITASGNLMTAGGIVAGGFGILVGGITNTRSTVQGAVSVFSGGIINSGTITAAVTGILVDHVSTFFGGLTNSGVIAETDNRDAILVVNVSTFSGGVTNAGSVTSKSANGIFIGSMATFAGNVVNSGTINAKQTGILISSIAQFGGGSAAGGITNSGTISAGKAGILVGGTATLSVGFGDAESVTISTFAGGIINTGTILAGGAGILVGGTATVSGVGQFNTASVTITTFAGSISNSGTISAAGAGILVGGDATASGVPLITASVTIATFADGISNSGTISAGGDGILIGGAAFGAHGSLTISTFTGGIFNSGTIVARGAGIFLGATTVSAVSVNGFAGGISNSGTIIARTGIVFGLAGVDSFSGAIINSGTITGTGGNAINVQSATSPVTIDQTGGLISGAIVLSANADVLNISGGTIAGDISGGGGVATQDTINFTLGSGTFTYGAAFGFATINQVNVNSGTVILDGESNATATTVYGGTLQIGDAANPGALLTSTVAVNGGILSGHGTIAGAVTVNAGGRLEPGGSIGTLTIAGGPLTFAVNSLYAIQLNDTAASNTVVSGGAAIINGGAVEAMPQYTTLGAHGGTTFTILTASNGRSGMFSGVTSDDPSFTGTFSLSYNTDDVLLNVGKGFQILPLTPGLTINQRNVVTGINNAIVTGVTIPANFQTLNGLTGPAYLNALNRVDGEDATGAQVGAFQLDDAFLNLMLNQFVDGSVGLFGSGGAGGAGGNAGSNNGGNGGEGCNTGFNNSGEDNTGFNSCGEGGVGGNAGLLDYAPLPTKALPAATFQQRWTAWGAGFGGSATTNGDPTVGSNNVTTSTHGYAAGLAYHLSPDTVLGFSLAGGGTNWNLANALGTGRSDAFLAGLYGVTHQGPWYLGAALAFANNWFTTNRTALGDQLRANFIGQSYSARFEGGYRYAVLPTLGVTPYAAVELQDFHTPSYSETDLTAGGFGLAYNALSATDMRTELGARFDAPTIAYGKPLVLYGRLAWAHDFVSTPSLNATFQLLPGSGFTVFGAPVPHDSALATAGAQLFLTHNWSLIGTFNGQFASGSQTYTGSGTLRYTW